MLALRDKNQSFQKAQQWFHYIFNPTDTSTDVVPQRYWKVLPFLTTSSERLQDLLVLLDYTETDRRR